MLTRLRSVVVMIVLGVVVVSGCGDDDDPAAPVKPSDSISIKSVTPSAGLIADAPTDFVVVVECVLTSADSGEVAIGFNNVQVDKFNMISAAKILIAKSSGVHQFDVNVFVKDWGAAGDFKVYVNLAEHPHGPSWSPLATDTRVLTFQ